MRQTVHVFMLSSRTQRDSERRKRERRERKGMPNDQEHKIKLKMNSRRKLENAETLAEGHDNEIRKARTNNKPHKSFSSSSISSLEILIVIYYCMKVNNLSMCNENSCESHFPFVSIDRRQRRFCVASTFEPAISRTANNALAVALAAQQHFNRIDAIITVAVFTKLFNENLCNAIRLIKNILTHALT